MSHITGYGLDLQTFSHAVAKYSSIQLTLPRLPPCQHTSASVPYRFVILTFPALTRCILGVALPANHPHPDQGSGSSSHVFTCTSTSMQGEPVPKARHTYAQVVTREHEGQHTTSSRGVCHSAQDDGVHQSNRDTDVSFFPDITAMFCLLCVCLSLKRGTPKSDKAICTPSVTFPARI